MVLPAVDPRRLVCAKCGLEIGRLIDVEGEELLQIGELIVRQASGVCANCGTGFYYSLGDKRLERLIERQLKS